MSCAGRASEEQQELVEAVIHAGDFAGAFAAHQLDPLHGGRELFIVPQVAAQTHEILGKPQSHRLGFLAGIAAQCLGRRLDALQGKSPCRKLVENLGHALELLPRNEGLFELLKVNGRAVIDVQVAQLVAGEHVRQKPALFEARQPGVQAPIANLRGFHARVAGPLGVEQAARVFRLVEIVGQTALVFVGKKIGFGFGGLDARSESLQSLAEMLHPGFDLGERNAQMACVGTDPHARQDAAAAVDFPPERARAAPRGEPTPHAQPPPSPEAADGPFAPNSTRWRAAPTCNVSQRKSRKTSSTASRRSSSC